MCRRVGANPQNLDSSIGRNWSNFNRLFSQSSVMQQTKLFGTQGAGNAHLSFLSGSLVCDMEETRSADEPDHYDANPE
jgi:hypothetical protein